MPYRLVEATRSLRRRRWLSYGLGLVIFMSGFALRYALSPWLDEVPFITLLPSVLIAALVGGWQVGVMVTVLSALAAAYFFLPPYHTLAIAWPHSALMLGLFLFTAAIQLVVIYALNQAVDGLSAERDRVGILFRELQHRVANNMSFIASLLRLERRALADKTADADADAVLDEAEQRLATMARIHRRLYDPSIVTTPLGVYLEALTADILDATGARNVTVKVHVPSVTFELSRLLTLSLLVTEIVTNAIKHGFRDGAAGSIVISLDRQAEAYVLQIKDNGRGFSTGAAPGISVALDRSSAVHPEQSTSLGMLIIYSLARQLNGELSWSFDHGTTARLIFKT